jgi:hypothetical protein
MKRKTLKIIGLSLLAGVIVGMGLLARPLVDRLVESVAATDQERNSSSGPDPAPLLMIGPGPGAAYAALRISAGWSRSCC